MSKPLDVLRAQCGDLLDLVGSLDAGEWELPTRCPPMSVRELVTHCALAAAMTARLAETDASGREPNVDRARWWVSPSRRPPADILADAQQTAAALDAPGAASLLEREIDHMLGALSSLDPGAIVGTEWRTIRADELAGSRVLEIGVHTMDLGDATGRGERIHPDAATFVTAILDVLLGSQLPAVLVWDARTYILTGTGRRELLSNERHVLGPLAEKLPLLR